MRISKTQSRASQYRPIPIWGPKLLLLLTPNDHLGSACAAEYYMTLELVSWLKILLFIVSVFVCIIAPLFG